MSSVNFLLMFEFLALENETDRLSWNVSKELPLLAAWQPRRAQVSLTLYREINFSGGKRLYIKWCSRKKTKWNSIVVRRGVETERNKKKHG
jgi:hypothetical protein